MSEDGWQQMWDIFHQACDLKEKERAAFLDSACAEDPAMKKELLSLLAEYDNPATALGPNEDAHAAQATLRRPGDRIGPYRIVGIVGEGGMGVVYRADQLEPVRRTVALKLILPGMDSREVIARFEAERQVLARMDHANVARVYDAGTTEDGHPYFVMEYVEGVPITRYCDEHRLDLVERLALFRKVCNGVQHAHHRGIIHRDLKPTNILVTTQEDARVPKIIDFGIARSTDPLLSDKGALTGLGRMIGTPEYMSPEQAGLTGEDVDTRADVYALGVVLYELLVGAHPFGADELRKAGFEEIRRIIREVDPPRPSTRLAENRHTLPGTFSREVAGDLDWIVMKALEKDRDRRYDSPLALVSDLDRFRKNRPVEARPPSVTYRAGKFVRRHRIGVSAASMVLVAIITGVSVGGIGLIRARAAEKEARQETAVAMEVIGFLEKLFQVSEPGEAAANSLTAREILDRGVEDVQGTLHENPEVRSRILRTLGGVYLRLGLYEEARPLLEEAFELDLALNSESGLVTVDSMLKLAALEIETGHYEEALARYLKVEAVYDQERSGAGYENYLIMLANIGQVLSTLGRSGEALAYLEKAVEGTSTFYGSRAHETGKATYQLAVTCTEAGELARGLDLTLEALDIFESLHGDDHPWIQYTLNGLGILYWNQERYEEARPVFERSLASIQLTHGDQHPYTASLMNNLGLLLIRMEDYPQARKWTERALQLRLELLPADHPHQAVTYLNLAALDSRERRDEEAEIHFREGIRIRAAHFGDEYPALAASYQNLAEVLQRLGKSSEAEEMIAKAESLTTAKTLTTQADN